MAREQAELDRRHAAQLAALDEEEMDDEERERRRAKLRKEQEELQVSGKENVRSRGES